MTKSIQIPVYNKTYDRAYIKAMIKRCSDNGGSYESRKYLYVFMGGVMAVDAFERIPLKVLKAMRYNAVGKHTVTLATYKWAQVEMRNFTVTQEDIDAATEAANA